MVHQVKVVRLLVTAITILQTVQSVADVIPTPNLLHDSEFGSSSAPLNPFLSNPDDPWTPGVWNAEAADLLVGNTGAVSPHLPDGMIRVNLTTASLSQVSQIIDVSSFAEAIDTRHVFAKFSIWVNALESGVETAIFIRNLPAPLRPSSETSRRVDPTLGEMALIDFESNATNVWQKFEGVQPLEPNTRYLHFEFYGRNATIPPSGVHFDSASIRLSIRGDYNEDGVVDSADYVNWRKQLGHLVDKYSGADFNGNGVVDVEDYQPWRSNFGAGLTPSFSSGTTSFIPEPGSLLLGALGAVGLSMLRRGER